MADESNDIQNHRINTLEDDVKEMRTQLNDVHAFVQDVKRYGNITKKVVPLLSAVAVAVGVNADTVAKIAHAITAWFS